MWQEEGGLWPVHGPSCEAVLGPPLTAGALEGVVWPTPFTGFLAVGLEPGQQANSLSP